MCQNSDALKGYLDFPGGASDKEFTCLCRRRRRCKFDPWVCKIPWAKMAAHGQRSLAGYSPWGCKESGMTEHSTQQKQKAIYIVKYFPPFCHPLSSFAWWQPVSNFLYFFPEIYKFCVNLYPHFTDKEVETQRFQLLAQIMEMVSGRARILMQVFQLKTCYISDSKYPVDIAFWISNLLLFSVLTQTVIYPHKFLVFVNGTNILWPSVLKCCNNSWILVHSLMYNLLPSVSHIHPLFSTPTTGF